MIGAYAIPLLTEPLYCLHEGDHLDNKRPFWDQVESHPSCNGPNLSLEYELPNTHVHTLASIHTCIRLKNRSPTSQQHLTLSEKHGRWRACSPWRPFSRRVGSLWRQVWLASSLLEQILKNNSGECSFQSTYHLCSNSNNVSARRNWGQTWSRVSTQSEGELHHHCRMESVLVLPKNNYLCSIMPAKLLFFVSTYSSFCW